jgi:hypothetical protein
MTNNPYYKSSKKQVRNSIQLKFTIERFEKYDGKGKNAVIRYMQSKGCHCAPNDDIYGIDLLCTDLSNPDKSYKVEVEVRRWDNSGGLCPYDTIHIPYRKEKFLSEKFYYFIVTFDESHIYWTTSDAIKNSPIIEVPNQAINQGELFYNVPIDQFHIRQTK